MRMRLAGRSAVTRGIAFSIAAALILSSGLHVPALADGGAGGSAGAGTGGAGGTSSSTGTGGNGGASSVSNTCLLYTSPSPRDGLLSRMPSSA